MRKLTVLFIFGIAAASAYGIGLSAGPYYALSMPMGDIADDYEMGIIGFEGKLRVGVMPYLNADVGFGYHMKYKGKWEGLKESIEPGAELPEPGDIDDYYLTTIPITFGVSYPMRFDAMGVYVGGGGAFVMEKFNVGDSWTAEWKPPEGYAQDAPEDVNKPGFYIGGGFKYWFHERIAIDVNPRWMMVFDAKEDDEATENVDESTSNSMFIDVLIGADITIM